MPKRTRRTFTEEFKQDAVRMCQQPGMTMAEVSRNLGVHVSLLGPMEEKDDRRPTETDERTDGI